MCDIGAHCPNCDHAGFDADEISCFTVGRTITRSYICSKCGANVTVAVETDTGQPLAVIQGGRTIDR